MKTYKIIQVNSDSLEHGQSFDTVIHNKINDALKKTNNEDNKKSRRLFDIKYQCASVNNWRLSRYHYHYSALIIIEEMIEDNGS